MSVLGLTLPLKYGESATSLTSRLAVRNGVSSPDAFCLDLGLNWKRIIVGDPTELTSLARLSRTDFEQLVRFSPKVNGRGKYILNGEAVNKYCFNRQRIHICPHCIRKDIAEAGLIGAARRSWWQLSPYRTCGDHQAPLVELSPVISYLEAYDFTTQVGANLGFIEEACTTSVRREPTLFEKYVKNRFLGFQQNEFLDGMQFHVAIRLCETLGFSLAYGPTKTVRGAGNDDLLTAGQTGFEALASGKDGFREALHSLRTRDIDRKSAHRKDLDVLFRWLTPRTNCPEHRVVIDFVSEFIFQHYAVPIGRTVLNRKPTTRGLYTIAAACQQFGVNRERFRMLLIERGLVVRNGRGTRLIRLMNVDEAREFSDEVRCLVTRPEACRHLNVSAATFRSFVSSGIVQPKRWLQRNAEFFSLPDLDALLESTFKSAELFESCPAGLVDLYTASRPHCSIATIIGRILDGDLHQIGRLSTRSGLAALLVDPDEVRGSTFIDESASFTREKLVELLGVNAQTISYLVDEGLLLSRKDPLAISGRDVEVISRRSVETFMQNFVTLTCLARHLGRAAEPLRRQLIERGVTSIFMIDGLSDIFRQIDIDLLRLPKCPRL